MKGCDIVAKFNLIDEPWIAVISKESGDNLLLSLRDVFEKAPTLSQLAGDSKTQDFAVLRLLLAILQTVYSRMDASGQAYDQVDLTERYQQIKDVDEFDEDDYVQSLEETWQLIWEEGEFSEAVNDYLEAWYDRFYLFDDQYPFFQVTQADIAEDKISKSKASSIQAKNINRTISESGNKIALFSPSYGENKELLWADQVARWLLTFQGYSGLSDKVIFGKEKYKASKGWLFDIGGLYLGGRNLFETLWLNTVLVHPREEYRLNRQKPCWEFTGLETIDHYFSGDNCDNLAELYCAWSRAIYIDPESDLNKPFSFEVVKLPEINHVDNFLEPMTVWRKNASGENKGRYTPRKHVAGQSLWRSFGLVLPSNSKKEENEGESHRPEIITWLDYLDDITDSLLDDYPLTIHAISMQDDGNATSWVPTDEIYDELKIDDQVAADVSSAGWIPRINDTVTETKEAIERTFRYFLMEIKDIRNLGSNDFVDQKIEELYFLIDLPFRDWLIEIKPEDAKDQKIIQWRQVLRKIVMNKINHMVQEAGPRDYKGKVYEAKDGQTYLKNIATAYNTVTYFINKKLSVREDRHD